MHPKANSQNTPGVFKYFPLSNSYLQMSSASLSTVSSVSKENRNLPMAKYVQRSPANCHENLTKCEGYEKANLLDFF